MLNQSLLYPDFQNNIVNLGATMAEFLGQKPQHANLPTVAKQLNHKVKNIIYLVIDGMGVKILEKNLPSKSFLRQHIVQTVTSVFPSTTTAATTALITGQTSSQHGWFAWAVDFDGAVVELFRNRNFYTHEYLTDTNFIRKQLPHRTIWENHQTDRTIYTCLPSDCYQYANQNNLSYQSLHGMFRQLHKTCRQPDTKFIYCYYPDLDTAMHQHGTTARKARRLLQKLDRKIARLAQKFPDTTLVITADHGQIDIQGHDFICYDTELQNCLAHPIAWDGRAASFQIKKGYDQQFKQAFAKYSADFKLVPSQELINQGILGKFAPDSPLRKLVGDYVAIGQESGHILILKPPAKNKKLKKGAHSGLTPDEMLVPVIVANATDNQRE